MITGERHRHSYEINHENVFYAAYLDIYCPESGEKIVSTQVGIKNGEPQIHTLENAQIRVMRRGANKLAAHYELIHMETWRNLSQNSIRAMELPEFAEVKKWVYEQIEQNSTWTVVDNISVGSFILKGGGLSGSPWVGFE